MRINPEDLKDGEEMSINASQLVRLKADGRIYWCEDCQCFHPNENTGNIVEDKP